MKERYVICSSANQKEAEPNFELISKISLHSHSSTMLFKYLRYGGSLSHREKTCSTAFPGAPNFILEIVYIEPGMVAAKPRGSLCYIFTSSPLITRVY